jgi:small subunit ribosomal protein S16
MLTIRLTRKGKKNQPFFKVVVIDKKRSSKGGRAVEDLGFVDPLNKRKSLKKERVLYWLKNGAQPSSTVHNLLVAEKIIDEKKIHVSKFSKKKQAEVDKAIADAKVVAEKKEAASQSEASLAPEGAGTPVAEAPAEEPKSETPAQ